MLTLRKNKSTPKLDYGEVDDVLAAFNQEILKHGPLAELEFLEGKIDKNHIEWHRKHHKYLKEIMHKLIPILRNQ